jgi:hypothetical protein
VEKRNKKEKQNKKKEKKRLGNPRAPSIFDLAITK